MRAFIASRPETEKKVSSRSSALSAQQNEIFSWIRSEKSELIND